MLPAAFALAFTIAAAATSTAFTLAAIAVWAFPTCLCASGMGFATDGAGDAVALLAVLELLVDKVSYHRFQFFVGAAAPAVSTSLTCWSSVALTCIAALTFSDESNCVFGRSRRRVESELSGALGLEGVP